MLVCVDDTMVVMEMMRGFGVLWEGRMQEIVAFPAFPFPRHSNAVCLATLRSLNGEVVGGRLENFVPSNVSHSFQRIFVA